MTPGGGHERRAGFAAVAALVGAVAVLVACSGPPATQPSGQPGARPAVGAAASSGPVAELQAGLTSALVERVYATAAVRSAARGDRPSSAGGSLDEGSLALADLLGGPDADARERVAAGLRRVDQLQARDARAAGSPEASRARSELELAQRDLVPAVRRAVPAWTPGDVGERLLPDLVAQLPASGEAPYEGLRIVATRARETARVLALAIAEQRRLAAPGPRAAALRADLTGLLTEHVQLSGGLATELGRGGRLSAGTASARAALDANARALTGLLAVAYPAAAEPFGRAWSAHVSRIEAHAAEVAAGNPLGGASRDTPEQIARLFAGTVQGLPVDRLTAELTPLVEAQLQAVAGAARGGPQAAADLRVATARATVPAALVSAAIAEHLRLG
jgi:hypothetical protein